MSRLYDIKESNVINEEMLKKAVEEQGPQDQAGLIAKAEGLKYDKVTELRLDYRSKISQFSIFTFAFLLYVLLHTVYDAYFPEILKIDHLWQFTSLTKLQLDNNIIEKIDGLEKLTNLVWLGEFSSCLLLRTFFF